MKLKEYLINLVTFHAKVPRLEAQLVDANSAIKYLEDSLTAAVTGELPDTFDTNQFILAAQAKDYAKLCAEKLAAKAVETAA